jgi:hypothetical protein
MVDWNSCVGNRVISVSSVQESPLPSATGDSEDWVANWKMNIAKGLERARVYSGGPLVNSIPSEV